MRLRRVDGIAPVVPETVWHIVDQALGLSEVREDHPHHVDVPHLAIRTDVIDSARLSIQQSGKNRRAVVLHMDPVAHIQPVAIDRQRLAAQRVQDHQRDEFLGKLIRPVVIRAARDDDLLPVSVMMRERDQVRRSLARGVR